MVYVPRAAEEGSAPPGAPVGGAGDDELEAEEEVEHAVHHADEGIGARALSEEELGGDDVGDEVAEDRKGNERAHEFGVPDVAELSLILSNDVVLARHGGIGILQRGFDFSDPSLTLLRCKNTGKVRSLLARHSCLDFECKCFLLPVLHL
jgi:hypothetical protein